MNDPKGYPSRRGGHAGRAGRTLVLAAGATGVIFLLVLGCPIDVPHPETEEQSAAQRAAGAKAITTFLFMSPAATAAIDENAKTIGVSVPYGTSVTALIATFTTTGASVKIGSTAQVSGTTANDFSAPVTYTVTATDGTTTSYVVTVTVQAAPPSSAKAFTSFSFLNIPTSVQRTTIDEIARTIVVSVPYDYHDSAGFIPVFTTSPMTGVSILSTTQTSGVDRQDFRHPVVYTVSAQDGSTANYTVTVTFDSSFKVISFFYFSQPPVMWTGAIDENAKTIRVSVPSGTNVTALAANFSGFFARVSVGSTVQVNGTTANNFSAPVTYTVTAADGSTASYVVTVTDQAAPPSRNLIAFTTYRDGNAEIYVMRDDGSDPVNLTRNPAGDYHPAWSPDHTKLAFVSDRSGTAQIYVMNADGSGQTRLPLTDPGTAVADPAWSPDGTRMLFSVGWDSIATAKLDGTDARKVSPEPSVLGDVFHGPAWSPDGSRIVYETTYAVYWGILGSSVPWDLEVANVNGTGYFDLTPNRQGLADELAPGMWLSSSFGGRWSPDGTKFLFGNRFMIWDGTLSGTSTSCSLYVVRSPSGLISMSAADPPLAFAETDGEPAAWSPDGAAIVFTVSNPTGGDDIYVMNADGTGQRRLTSGSGPAW